MLMLCLRGAIPVLMAVPFAIRDGGSLLWTLFAWGAEARRAAAA